MSWSSPVYTDSSAWTSIAWGATAPNGTGGTGKQLAVNGSPLGVAAHGLPPKPYPGNSRTHAGLFVAVASSGTNQVATSPDGTTFTLQTAASTATWTSIAWSPSLALFVAVASSGTDRVMNSSDGVTWQLANAPTGAWMSIAWAAEAPDGSGGTGKGC